MNDKFTGLTGKGTSIDPLHKWLPIFKILLYVFQQCMYLNQPSLRVKILLNCQLKNEVSLAN